MTSKLQIEALLTLSQKSPSFYVSFLKTLWEKEKLLVTSYFSFFPQRFLTIWRTICRFHQIWICCLQTHSYWNSLKFVVLERVNPLPGKVFQTLPNWKSLQTTNFKFDENSRKLSKWLENTVGKGEIARYEQFLLFPQCFQNACFPGASKGVIVWERVNPSI